MKTSVVEYAHKELTTKYTCPNKRNHVSAFPGNGKMRCPLCSSYPCLEAPVYIEKLKGWED
jgi:hypothetical protein